MSRILRTNVEDLLHSRGVESARIEFKASWNPETTGHQVLKTICAFANDLQNLNGGYIIIGVEEKDGLAVRPVKGVTSQEIESIQKWIRGNCNRIDPVVQTIQSPEKIDDRHVLVIWVEGSDNRPHSVAVESKGQRIFFVRLGCETVDATQNGVLQQLMQMTARVPFDDRRAPQATIEDIREQKVREFLKDINSGLLEERDTKELYRKLKIAIPINGYDVPKNIGLLMFSQDPDDWFRGTRIEIVQFAAGSAGNVTEERIFRGGIHEQLRNALACLETISSQHMEKQPHSFHVKGWVSYPIQALREALVNAVYHRSYEGPPEPVKVYLYPDRMDIISYPGPVHGIQLEHLQHQHSIPPYVPARNRRVGELLKELKLAEGRGTGMPKIFKAMTENGSPEPVFHFDAYRTYFCVSLPVHPEYGAISALRDAAYLRAVGNTADAQHRIQQAWEHQPSSPSLTGELIRIFGNNRDTDAATSVFTQFTDCADTSFIPHISNILIEVLLQAGLKDEAKKLLETLPHYLSYSDAFDAAILSRRLGDEHIAHRYFERGGDTILHDARALHEFAQTKINLANTLSKQRPDKTSQNRLRQEARELLERVTQLNTDNKRRAWAFRDLGRVKKILEYPLADVVAAYKRAAALLPDEPRFAEELAKLQKERC